LNTNQAQTSIKNIVAESFSLNPSALLSFYEIDISNLGLNMGEISQSEVDSSKNTIFRFHNNISLYTNSLFWQGVEYIAAPILADGFGINVIATNLCPVKSLTCRLLLNANCS